MRSLVSRMERWTDALLRSRAARWGGLIVGLAAIAFLALSLVEAGDAALARFTGLGPLQVGAIALGLAVYHWAAVVTLRPIFRGPALRIWGAAQLVKYLPVPGSALLGVVGATVQGGGTSRHGLAVVVRHSLLHVGAATLVALPAAGAFAERAVGIPTPITWIVGAVGGLAVAWVAVRHLPVPSALGCIVVSTAGWQVLGVLLAYGFADGASVVAVGSAFAAAWVVGQLALPVPAGIGIREAALLLLLAPVLGEVGALSFALGTRLAHAASDGVLAAVVLGRRGVRALAEADDTTS